MYQGLSKSGQGYVDQLLAIRASQEQQQILQAEQQAILFAQQKQALDEKRKQDLLGVDDTVKSFSQDDLKYGAVRHMIDRDKVAIDFDHDLALTELQLTGQDRNYALSALKNRADLLEKKYGDKIKPFEETAFFKKAAENSSAAPFQALSKTVDLLTETINTLADTPENQRTGLAKSFLTGLVNSAKGNSDAEQVSEQLWKSPELFNLYSYANATGKSIYNPSTIAGFLASKEGIDFESKFKTNPNAYIDKATAIRNAVAESYNKQARERVIFPTSPAIARDLGVVEKDIIPTLSERDALNRKEAQQAGGVQGTQGVQATPQAAPVSPWKAVGQDILQAAAPTIRGAGPVGAGAAIGGLLGGPPGALAGAATVGLTQLVGDPTIEVLNGVFGLNLTPPSRAFQDILTRIGVPESQGALQKAVQGAVAGAADVVSGMGIGKALVATSRPVLVRIGAGLQEALGMQTAAGAAAGASAVSAEEAAKAVGLESAAPYIGLAGGLAGGMITGGAAIGLSELAKGRAVRLEEAAQKTAESVLQKFTQDPVKARAEMNAAKEMGIASGGFQPMAGEISGDAGLAALQQTLYNRSSALKERLFQNQQEISKGASEILKSGEIPQDKMSKWFASQNEDVIKAAEELKAAYLKEGDMASATIIDKAQAQVNALNAAAIDDQISSQQAYNLASKKLQEAQFEVANARGIKFDLNQLAERVFDSEKKIARESASKMFTDAGAGEVTIPFNHTIDAAKAAAGEISKIGDLPPRVEKILKAYKGKKGKIYSDTALELSNAISDVNDDWNAVKLTEPKKARILNNIKQAMLKDLESADLVSDDLKEARKAWFDYASLYVNGPANRISEKVSFIDAFMQKGPKGAEQLKSALKVGERADSTSAVTDWFVNNLAQRLGESPSAGAIGKWQTGNDIAPLLRVFPEASKKVDSIKQSIAAAEGSVNKRAEIIAGLKADEVQMAQPEKHRILTEAKREASKITKWTEGLGAQALDTAREEISKNAATKFIGADPQIAVGRLIEGSKNPIADFDQLLAAASQDQSGLALEGIKSATKKWYESSMKILGQVVSSSNDPKKLSAEDLAVSLARMNEVLLSDTTKRAILEKVLSKDELAALDIVRKQVEIVSRKYKASAGMSPTSMNIESSMQVDAALSETTLGLLGKLAAGATFDELRRGATPGFASKLINLIQTAWKGDVNKRSMQILEQALLNTDIASNMLLKVDSQDRFNRVAAFLRPALSSAAAQLNKQPFTPGSVDTQKINNNVVITDTNYGFRVIQTPSKKYKLFSPDGKKVLGVFDSVEKAQSEAVKKFNSNVK